MLSIDRPIEYLLSGISSTSAIITRYIRSVRAAHAELGAATRDLSDLRLVLELLREERAVPLVLQGQILLVLENCGNVLIHIDNVLAQCPEPAKWVDLGQDEIRRCRTTLALSREALALALEVVSLNSLPSNTADADSLSENIHAEVRRLLEQARSVQHDTEDAEPVLATYLGVVNGCLQRSGSVGERQDSKLSVTPMERDSAIEPGPPSLDASREAPVAESQPNNEGVEHSLPTAQQEAAAVGHPTKDSSLPYYTEEPTPMTPRREAGSVPNPPESPTLPEFEGHRPPVAQRPLPPPLAQPILKRSESFSMKSEPPTPWSSLGTDSPAFSPSRIHEYNGEYFAQDGRAISFASHGSGGSSSGSVPRASLDMTPSPFPSSPPPDYRRTWIDAPTPSRSCFVSTPLKSPHRRPIVITPKRHLTEKGKSSEILHMDISPGSCYVATKHGNKSVKIWSVARNSLHGTIKITSYVQPRVRSREYFIRSHAILSESATLIGITTHFGLTLEIYNFAKGGSGAKKVQVIEEAHRWAASQRDAVRNDYAGLAVYRPKFDRIDRYFFARHPGAREPLRQDPNHSIEFLKADLPFLPKFPELAYSSDSSLLVAAAGPRPGDPVRTHSAILVAWRVNPVSDDKLHSQTPDQSTTSLPDEARHKPYRVCVPAHPALHSALPVCLASHGNTAVSIWIPAATPNEATSTTITTATSLLSPASTTTTKSTSRSASKTSFPFRPRPKRHHAAPPPAPLTPITTTTTTTNPPSTTTATAPDRLVLTWDLLTNTTRLFAIPPFSQACISPDCRRVAYCNAPRGEFVVVDVPPPPPPSTSTSSSPAATHGYGTAEEVWRWPDAAREQGFASYGQLERLAGVSVFEFSPDGGMLVVGDRAGGVGVYEIGEGEERFELGVGDEVAWADVVQEGVGGGRV